MFRKCSLLLGLLLSHSAFAVGNMSNFGIYMDSSLKNHAVQFDGLVFVGEYNKYKLQCVYGSVTPPFYISSDTYHRAASAGCEAMDYGDLPPGKMDFAVARLVFEYKGQKLEIPVNFPIDPWRVEPQGRTTLYNLILTDNDTLSFRQLYR